MHSIMKAIYILVYNMTVSAGIYGNVLFAKWTMTMKK